MTHGGMEMIWGGIGRAGGLPDFLCCFMTIRSQSKIHWLDFATVTTYPKHLSYVTPWKFLSHTTICLMWIFREFCWPLLVTILANGSLVSVHASTITVAMGKGYGDSQASSLVLAQPWHVTFIHISCVILSHMSTPNLKELLPCHAPRRWRCRNTWWAALMTTFQS